ncbi:MAG: hypothetical protein V4772_25385 [Pseudomonadota bacterium]
MQAVSTIRQQHADHPALAQASTEVKNFQSRRFQATYADLLKSPRYEAATRFFLHELYGDKDYAERDQQFARIATTITRLFPQAVVDTATALSEVHALTEQLDDLMARQWLAGGSQATHLSESARYIHAWRGVADAPARYRQLEVVLHLGRELNRLTRKPGLRTLLKMMRRPAAAAGLSSLQGFLEAGFDAFADMGGADEFLNIIEQRETMWVHCLFDDTAVTCETKLAVLLRTLEPQ